MKQIYTCLLKTGILRSLIIFLMGAMVGLPQEQTRSIQSSPEPAITRLSSSYFPITLKLARPDQTPTLRPLFTRVLKMDGSDDYAYAPDRASLDLGRGEQKDFTIETFFYVPSSASGARTLLEREQYHLKLIFEPDTADGIQFVIHLENGDLSLFPVVDLKSGWHHVAVVFNEEASPGKDTAAIFLDGSLEATRTDPNWGLVLNSSTPLYIGSPASSPYRGSIEELRLSAVARYPTNFTVPDHYFAPDESTRALWHFDETPGSSRFADYSSKSNHLTGMNGVTTIEPGD